MKRSASAVFGLVILWGSLASRTALAQAAATTPGGAPSQATPPALPAGAATPAAAPAAVPAPAPASASVATTADNPAEAETAPREDHDRFIHHFGVTYFDITSLPVANPIANVGGAVSPQPAPGTISSTTVSAPVVGIRYWIERNLGIDVGIGLGFAGGSQEAVAGSVDTTVDKVSTTGFAFHGGLPIAFAHGRHYTFLAIPQLTIGFTSGTFKQPAGSSFAAPPPEQDLSGFLLDAGAAVGAEIQFGFIGVPELALQATVGLSYRRSVFKWKSGSNSASDGTNSFGTNVSADPWAIFKDAISATYYF